VAQWLEYGMSASVMLWLISSLSGVVDVSILTTIVVQNVVLQYIGYRLSLASDRTEYNRLLTVGFALHLCIWLPIVTSFYTSVQVSNATSTNGVPAIVYYIIWFMLGLFTVFGIYPVAKDISTLQTPGRVYPILSLVTKSLLTWMVFFGVVREE
jgi:hypothetical protein